LAEESSALQGVQLAGDVESDDFALSKNILHGIPTILQSVAGKQEQKRRTRNKKTTRNIAI